MTEALDARVVSVVAFRMDGYDDMLSDRPELGSHPTLGSLSARVAHHFKKSGAVILHQPAEHPQHVICVFGVHRSTPDDVILALRAAVEVRTMVRDASAQAWREADGPLNVRFGVNTGKLLIAGSGDPPFDSKSAVISDAVTLAQAAEPDGILTDELTRRTGGEGFALAAGKPIQIDDDPATTITTWSLATRTAKRRTGRRSVVMTGNAGRSLIGRSSEISKVRKLFHEAVAIGTLRRCEIVGATGVGKTRLVRDLVQNLRSSHGDLLVAEPTIPSRDGMASPFGILGRIVTSLASLDTASTVEEARDKLSDFLEAIQEQSGQQIHPYHQTWIRHLADVDQAPAAGGDPELAAERCQRAVIAMLRAAAQRGPLVIVVENASDEQPAVLKTIGRLSSDLSDLPVLIVLTSREPLRKRPRLDIGEHLVERVTLGALSRDAARVLLDQLLGRPQALSHDDADRLARHASYNALYLEEAVALLTAAELIGFDATTGRWSLDEDTLKSVPDSLEGVIAARLDQLPEGAMSLLTKAAIAGDVFWRELLEDLDEPQVGHNLELLEEQGLVRRSYANRLEGHIAYEFTHRITRRIAGNDVWEDEAEALHARIARWLAVHAGERFNAWLGAIARHFAFAGDATRAVPYHMQAGEWARAHGDIVEAAYHFEQAQKLSNVPEVELEASAELAAAIWFEGEHQRALAELDRVLEGARAKKDVRLQLRCHVLRARFAQSLMRRKASSESTARGLELATRMGATRERGVLLLTRAGLHLDALEDKEALDAAGDAVPCFAEVEDRLGQVRAAMEAARPLLHSGQLTRAAVALEEVARAAKEHHHWVLMERARHGIAWIDYLAGRLDRAENGFRTCQVVFARIGLTRHELRAQLGLALTMLDTGRLFPAVNLAGSALEAAEAEAYFAPIKPLARAVVGHALSAVAASGQHLDPDMLLPAGKAVAGLDVRELLIGAADTVDPSKDHPRLYRVLALLFAAEFLARTEPKSEEAARLGARLGELIADYERCPIADRALAARHSTAA